MKIKNLALKLTFIFAVFILFSCEKEPYASFEAPDIINVGDVVYFNNTSIDGYSYYWNFGDGKTSTVYSPSHTYTTAGPYTVKLTAYSKSKNKDNSATFTIDVKNTTDLSLIVYINGTTNVVSNCRIRLFKTKNDWDHYTNVIANGYTNSSGKIVFTGLKEIVYYIDAYRVGYSGSGYYCNWYLGYMTNTLIANTVNSYKIYVKYYTSKEGVESYKIVSIEPILPGNENLENNSVKSNNIVVGNEFKKLLSY